MLIGAEIIVTRVLEIATALKGLAMTRNFDGLVRRVGVFCMKNCKYWKIQVFSHFMVEFMDDM